MDCILHVGLHKTGSTAIQHALAGYDDGDSFYADFSGPGDCDVGTTNHSIPFFTIFSEDRLTYHFWRNIGLSQQAVERERSTYSSQLEKNLRRPRSRAIFSGEDISKLSRKNLQHLRSFFGDFVDRVRVLIYVRDPQSYALSSFQEEVKHGLNYIPTTISSCSKVKIENFRGVFGKENVLVRDYNKASQRNLDIVFDFASVFDLDYNKLAKCRANVSLSSEALKLLFMFNKTNCLHSGDPILASARTKLMSIIQSIQGEALDKDIFFNLADRSDLSYLSQNWGIEFEVRPPDEHRNLDSYLRDIKPSSIDKLLAHLTSLGVRHDYGRDPVKILNKLYYLLMQQEDTSALRGAYDEQKSRYSDLKSKHQRLRFQIAQIHSSHLWKATRPFRIIGQAARDMRRLYQRQSAG